MWEKGQDVTRIIVSFTGTLIANNLVPLRTADDADEGSISITGSWLLVAGSSAGLSWASPVMLGTRVGTCARAGQGRAGQGRGVQCTAGQGRAGECSAGQGSAGPRGVPGTWPNHFRFCSY